MRCCVLVNEPTELGPTQTTTALIERIAAREHEVYVSSVVALSYTPDEHVIARARRVPGPSFSSLEALTAALCARDPEPLVLDEVDVLLIRTNPGRDLERTWAHQTALLFARLLRERGVLVLNDPDGLLRASSKFYLQSLPATVRPKTLVSRDPEEILAFIERLGAPVILKPLQGSRGADVFLIRTVEDANVRQIMEVLMRQGFPLVQAFVPEAVAGDTRVVVLEGALLEVAGRVAAVRRVPGHSDFRSNVWVGGRAAPAQPTATMRAIAATVGPVLARDGIFLAGLDLIGDKLVEINVFSTGGLGDAAHFEGADFITAIVEAIERRLASLVP